VQRKSSKFLKSAFAVYMIVLAVYVIGFFAVPMRKPAACWIAFAFTVIAIIGSWLVFNYAFNAKETIVSKIYGYPIFKVGAVYAAAQTAASIIIFVIASFTTVPYWAALVLSVIMMGAAAIGIIITDSTRDLVEQIDETTKIETENVAHFQISIAGIIDCCEDSALKSELQRLDEAFSYSDPVSNQHTKEIEGKICNLLDTLKNCVENNNAAEAMAYIKKISNALAERNRICKATKEN
jgi:signal transduction histidine kinase